MEFEFPNQNISQIVPYTQNNYTNIKELNDEIQQEFVFNNNSININIDQRVMQGYSVAGPDQTVIANRLNIDDRDILIQKAFANENVR